LQKWVFKYNDTDENATFKLFKGLTSIVAYSRSLLRANLSENNLYHSSGKGRFASRAINYVATGGARAPNLLFALP